MADGRLDSLLLRACTPSQFRECRFMPCDSSHTCTSPPQASCDMLSGHSGICVSAYLSLWPATLASVPAHEFALSEDVALYGLFDIGLRGRPFQGKFRIE